jgi:ATP-binding cassette subfamily B protein
MGRPGGGMMMQGAGEKPKHFKSTIATLVRYMKPFWWRIGAVLVFAIISTVFAIVSPKILGNITTKIVDGYVSQVAYDQITARLPKGVRLPASTTGATVLKRLPASQLAKIPASDLKKIEQLDLTAGRPQLDFGYIKLLGLWLILLYAISAAFMYLQGWIMTDVTQQVTYRLRRDLAHKMNHLPLKYFDGRTHGEVLSRVTNDVDTISQTLNQSLTQIVTSVTMVIGILIMMLTISWQMTLLALFMLPLSLGGAFFIVKRSQRYFLGQQANLGHLNGHVEEMYAGHMVMKVFNGEQRSIAKFRQVNNRLYDSAWKSQFLSGLLMPLTVFIGNLGYVGVAILGGWLAVNGKVNIGDIQAFIQYMSQFTQPITQTANVANVLQSTAAAAERVFEFLDEREEVAEAASPVQLPSVKGSVKFDHVVFGYHPDKVIIKDFTAEVKPGQRIAIVGPTGAGKTTIVNLLMRFYDVDKGAITVDGVDIRDMRRADARKLFGMVLQDTWLFSGSLEENIAYGRRDAGGAAVRAAAKAAHADHFIRALPDGYQMQLNEEADNVSQGEKQLLTIARAMLADTPMLILDEATSSVDSRTESLIQEAMDRLMEGRTSFVIAHRLSTIRKADLILVMRDGNIVEQGKHNELLAQNGFYASLYNSQFSTGLTLDELAA